MNLTFGPKVAIFIFYENSGLTGFLEFIYYILSSKKAHVDKSIEKHI